MPPALHKGTPPLHFFAKLSFFPPAQRTSPIIFPSPARAFLFTDRAAARGPSVPAKPPEGNSMPVFHHPALLHWLALNR